MYGDSFLYTNDAYSIQSFQYGVVGKLSLRKHAILGRIMTGNIRCDVRNRGFIPIKSFKFDYYYFTVLSEYQLMNNVSLGGGFSLAVFRNLYETTSGLKVNHISDFISQKQLNLELTLNYFWNNVNASVQWSRTLFNFEDSITLRSFQTVSGFSVNLTYLFKIQL